MSPVEPAGTEAMRGAAGEGAVLLCMEVFWSIPGPPPSYEGGLKETLRGA